jgi:hypothetical protein
MAKKADTKPTPTVAFDHINRQIPPEPHTANHLGDEVMKVFKV